MSEIIKDMKWPEPAKRARAPKYNYAAMEVNDGINTGLKPYMDKDGVTERTPNVASGAKAWAKKEGFDWKFTQHTINGEVWLRRTA